ncbi:unnamed protein product [Menidia menidia]|uniref:(Atlantic silverside) hypothetical protein n=1 Tax=Menidia menidia TaxID=238744 RepID=A0A8S4ARP4_9TELE|nr:unnamed protein product [Menidia menidia]
MEVENQQNDKVVHQSNGKVNSNGAEKETQGLVRTFRESMKRVKVKGILSPKSKDSEVTPKKDTTGSETGSTSPIPPPSPSLSTSSLPGIFPNFFKKKTDDHADTLPQGDTQLTRSNTDPSSTWTKKLRLSKRKIKPVGSENNTIIEDSVETQKEEDEEAAMGEIEESYTLQELPPTPLSVMQINKLIELEVLEEAYVNLLAMRQELQRDLEQFADNYSSELAKKEKDLRILYEELRNKITSIVRDSNSVPARNKGLLVPVARIIQEEEKRAKEPGGLPESWMEAWKDAVRQGVKAKVSGVPQEQNDKASSLAVHLGLLGQAIVEDLEIVKRELRWSYPPSFKVFSTYVKSYHAVVGQHLKKLEQQATELKDLYHLLDWIHNKYKSEKIMGSLSLQPDMMEESTDLLLEEGFLEHLSGKYCCRAQEDFRGTLVRVIELENELIWSKRKEPEKEDDFLMSQFPMDIWTNIKGVILNSGKLHADLEKKVATSCLKELKNFPQRFETEFQRHCSTLPPEPRWTEYQITYINSFTALLEHMKGYQDSCPGEVEEFTKEVDLLIKRLLQGLEDQFKENVKPYLRRMMTRKWLTSEDDFNHLYNHINILSKHCKLMKPPNVQEFVSRLHYHVVREYIGQLMKNNYTCKNRKHEKAATKINQQWEKLTDLFEDMKSTHEWLNSVGHELCSIIGEKTAADIKKNLQPLVQHYPDFSKKHLVAVLYFRGLPKDREYQLILQQLTALKKDTPQSLGSQLLFRDMEVNANTNCLSNLPFPCLCVRASDS